MVSSNHKSFVIITELITVPTIFLITLSHLQKSLKLDLLSILYPVLSCSSGTSVHSALVVAHSLRCSIDLRHGWEWISRSSLTTMWIGPYCRWSIAHKLYLCHRHHKRNRNVRRVWSIGKKVFNLTIFVVLHLQRSGCCSILSFVGLSGHLDSELLPASPTCKSSTVPWRLTVISLLKFPESLEAGCSLFIEMLIRIRRL
jgi:hypothetical protein